MSAGEFFNTITIILAVMAVATLVETALPMFAAGAWNEARRGANLALTALTFLSNWLLTSLAAVAAVALRPAGLMASLGLPAWLEIACGIVIVDFSIGYLAHRTMHAWPVMWRFHAIHHSDRFVDATTTFRTHPVETLWRFVFAIAPVWLLGIPAEAVVIQRLLQTTNGVLQHANIRLWSPLDRVLSLVWVTPNVHKIHHSRAISETNSNYANLVTLYDRLLGTYTPAERANAVVYGLDDLDPDRVESLSGLLTMPFETPEARGLPDTKIRLETGGGR